MYDTIRETVFGRIVNVTSGGKFFPPEEQRDPSLLQRYTVIKSPSASDPSIQTGTEARVHDTEKGSDYQLVDWNDNDPEVCNTSIGKNSFSLLVVESQELVDTQKVLCHFPDLPLNDFGIHRIGNIYCRARGSNTRIPCQRDSSSAWPYAVCYWLCARTNDMGMVLELSYVGDVQQADKHTGPYVGSSFLRP